MITSIWTAVHPVCPQTLPRLHSGSLPGIFRGCGRHHLHLRPCDPGADGRMRIFNADGSEAQMCGNGVRCVAEWLYTHGVGKPVLTIDTNSGVKRITRQGAQLWQVEMGAYSTLPADLPAIHMGEGPLVDQPLTVEGKVWKVTCISVGNPTA